MAAFRLFAKLATYYAVLALALAGLFWLWPDSRDYLPVGRVQALIAQGGGLALKGRAGLDIAHAGSFGASLVWLGGAVAAALLAALPVSWVYMAIRNPEDYDQSLIDSIVILPLVVTSIVVVVQHSLALSFSLAGIAGAARYRNTLKSSGDLLFILLSIGIGLSTGIGAMELALVSSAAFNLAFLTLWATSYGERAEMKRFLGHAGGSTTTTTTAVVTETVETRPS